MMPVYTSTITGEINIQQFANIAGLSRPTVYKMIENNELMLSWDDSLYKMEALQLRITNEGRHLLTFKDLIELVEVYRKVETSDIHPITSAISDVLCIFNIYNKTKDGSIYNVKQYMLMYMKLIVENLSRYIGNQKITRFTQLYVEKNCKEGFERVLRLTKDNTEELYITNESLTLIKEVYYNRFDVDIDSLLESIWIVMDFNRYAYLSTMEEKAHVFDTIVLPLFETVFEVVLNYMDKNIMTNHTDRSYDTMLMKHMIRSTIYLHSHRSLKHDECLKSIAYGSMI